MPAASLHALLAHSIDYAGMFPPCSLPLETAVQNHAQYVRSPDAWMLNGFVLPIDQFEAAVPHLASFDKKHPLRVAALGSKDADLKRAGEMIREFTREHIEAVSVVQLEIPAPLRAGGALDVDLAYLRDAREMFTDSKLHVFWETPSDSAEETIRLLAELKEPRFGFKLRTGGVTADAFPTSVQIAEALLAATKHHVAIKFTAGLQHPLRQFRDEVGTKLHGLLNAP